MHQLRQNGDLWVAFHHNLMRTLLITSCKDPLPWSLYPASAYQQGGTHVELTFYTFFLVSTAFQDILNFVVILYRWKLTDSYNPPNKSEEVIFFFLWSQSCTLSFNSDLSVLSEILKKCLLCPLLKKKWCQKYYHKAINNCIWNDSTLYKTRSSDCLHYFFRDTKTGSGIR